MTKFEEKKKEAYEKASMKQFGNADGSRAMRYLLNELENAGLLKPQQALPVVPECVAGAIERIPDDYSAFEALDLIKSKVEILTEENEDWLPVFNWLCEGIENQDIFALAYITRKYEVEKPQLFYIALPNVYGLSDSVFVSKIENRKILEFTNTKGYGLKLTEQEIKSIDERYLQFAVPVEVQE